MSFFPILNSSVQYLLKQTVVLFVTIILYVMLFSPKVFCAADHPINPAGYIQGCVFTHFENAIGKAEELQEYQKRGRYSEDLRQFSESEGKKIPAYLMAKAIIGCRGNMMDIFAVALGSGAKSLLRKIASWRCEKLPIPMYSIEDLIEFAGCIVKGGYDVCRSGAVDDGLSEMIAQCLRREIIRCGPSLFKGNYPDKPIERDPDSNDVIYEAFTRIPLVKIAPSMPSTNNQKELKSNMVDTNTPLADELALFTGGNQEKSELNPTDIENIKMLLMEPNILEVALKTLNLPPQFSPMESLTDVYPAPTHSPALIQEASSSSQSTSYHKEEYLARDPTEGPVPVTLPAEMKILHKNTIRQNLPTQASTQVLNPYQNAEQYHNISHQIKVVLKYVAQMLIITMLCLMICVFSQVLTFHLLHVARILRLRISNVSLGLKSVLIMQNIILIH